MARTQNDDDKPERSYRGVGIAQRKAERRARLIEAAVHCFGNSGYHHTTLKALCAQAGLTERYFYESFENFDELLCCSYDFAAEQILSLVTLAVVKAGDAPVDRAQAGLNAYFKAISADPARARLVLIEIEGASERANDVYRTRLRKSADLIRLDILQALPEPGRGLSAQVLTMGLLGALYQLAKEWVLSDFKLSRAALVRNVNAIFTGTLGQWMPPEPAAAPVPAKAGQP